MARLRFLEGPGRLVLILLALGVGLAGPGARAQCIDYAEQMRWTASVALGVARDVAVQDGQACLVGQFGLALLEVDDPQAPQLLSEVDPPGTPSAVVWQGDLAFIASGSAGLLVYDVSNPASPVLVSSLALPGVAVDVVTRDDLAFVAARDEGVHVIGIADPLQPQLLGTYDGMADCVSVAAPPGHYIYTADKFHAVDVIDVDDPTDPTVMRQVLLSGTTLDLAVDGSHLFVAGGYAGLHVIDIADPLAAQLLQTSTEHGYSAGVTAADGFAYVADGALGLMVYDVQSVATEPPTLAASVDLPGGTDRLRLSSPGTLLVCGSGGLHVVDISSGQTPRPTARLELDGDANAVAGDGGALVYVAADAAGLAVVDLGNPQAPQVVGQIDLDGSAIDVAVAGSYAYLVNYWASVGLQIIDISDPAQPQLAGTADLPGAFYTLAVAVSGTRACVALASDGLAVVDIADPTAPVLRGTVATPGNALAVAISGSHAFVLDSVFRGMIVVNIANPDAPYQVASLPTTYYANDLVVADGLAYLADGNDGLLVVDVADPSQPQALATLDLWGRAVHLEVADGLAYVLAGYSGYTSLHVVDVSDPSAPALLGSADTPTSYGVVPANGQIVVAGGRSGLLVLPGHCDGVTATPALVGGGVLRAFPNPTSGSTTFRLRTAGAGPMRAVIYNVAGRRVRELVDGSLNDGPRTLNWDGRDDQGRSAPAGTYLVKVAAGQQVYSSRVVLLK